MTLTDDDLKRLKDAGGGEVMKTAEEVANGVTRKWSDPNFIGHGYGGKTKTHTVTLKEMQAHIAQALTVYAEERVKEAISDEIKTGAQLSALISEDMRKAKYDDAIQGIKQKARNEALEEASGIARSHCHCPEVAHTWLAHEIADEIRTLKKP